MTDHEETAPQLSKIGRRVVLQGAGLTGAAAILAACGSDEPSTSTPTASTSPSESPSDSPTDDPGTGQPQAEVLAETADVPVDGGVIVDDTVVVTQPEQGTFKGFSAICTHAGCVVSDVAAGIISCACHGSEYSIEDGSVIQGPAPSPLPEVPVKVEKGQVVRA